MGFGASQAEAGDNSIPCLRFVSCQQAASGAPKCTICDHQVRGAITLCPTASDDENVLGHFCFGWQGKTGTGVMTTATFSLIGPIGQKSGRYDRLLFFPPG